jgi:hypothetical protein
MKGKICALGIALVAVCSTAFAQPKTPSKLSDTTMDCFTNAIDWTAGPNEKFNKQQNDYIIGGLDFTGGDFGYYKSGSIPFSIKGRVKATKDATSTTESTAGTATTTYSRPFFNDCDFHIAATAGFPSANDLSIGFDFNTLGSDDGYTTSGATTTTVTNKTGTINVEIPFGMRIGDGYNYASVGATTDWYKTGTADRSQWVFSIYDQYRFASIIPGGAYTAISAKFTTPKKTSLAVATTVTTTIFELKALNRFDVPIVDGVTFVFIPQISASLTGKTDQTVAGTTTTDLNTAFTFASAMAVKAVFPGTPIYVSAGIRPFVKFNVNGGTIVTAATSSKTLGYGIFSDNETLAILCITAVLPSDVSLDLQVMSTSNFALECVIPLKPAPAPAPRAAPAKKAEKPVAKEAPKKAEKPATQPAPQAAAKPADKAATKQN